LLLSENKKDILTFFGFDTSIEYDKLTEKNTFEYLCTSTRLKPMYIQYTGFKGPYAKNKEHEKFNEYLKGKHYPRRSSSNDEYYKQLALEKQSYTNDAIEFFKKENAYIEYKERKKLLDKVMEKHDAIKGLESRYIWCDFSQFIKLHGVLNIAEMSIDKVTALWNQFKTQNWSGLRVI
jgi:hypothetical protein